MIASIQGRLIRKSEEHVILEQGGIGYRLDVAPSDIASLPHVGGDRKALYIPSRT